MYFPGYITLTELKRQESNDRAIEFQAALNLQNQIAIKSLDLLSRALPLLNRYCQKRAIPIELVNFGSRRRKPKLIGGWVLGEHYFDYVRTDPDPAYFVSVAITEDGKLVHGQLTQRADLQVLVVSKYQRQHKPVHKLNKKMHRYPSQSIRPSLDHASSRLLANPVGLSDMLSGYLGKRSPKLRSRDW